MTTQTISKYGKYNLPQLNSALEERIKQLVDKVDVANFKY
jgi:hypothetical protein